MRGIVKKGPGPGVELTQVDEPTCSPGEVLLQVDATSVCGTDLELVEWSESAQAFDPSLPLTLGHECSGTVIDAAPDVTGLAAGDRVAVESHLHCGVCRLCRTGLGHNCQDMRLFGLTYNGAFADRVVVPAANCFAIPETVSSRAAALYEPAGVAVHGLQLAGDLAGRSVFVSGCGPVGLFLVALAAATGAAEVIAAEPNATRRRRAEELGATTFDPGDDRAALLRHSATLDGRGGVSVAFEVSGAAPAWDLIFHVLGRESRLVSIGHPGTAVSVDVAARINKQGVAWAGVFGRRIWTTWWLLDQMVRGGVIDLEGFIAEEIVLDDLPGLIDRVADIPGKVVVRP